MSSLAFNCSQAMIQRNNSNSSIQASDGATASNLPAERLYPQQQGWHQSLAQLAIPNQANQNTINNLIEAGSSINANGAVAATRPLVLVGNHQQHQDCRESLQLATPNQVHENTLNNTVQAGSNGNANCEVFGAPRAHVGNNSQQQDCSKALQLATLNQTHEQALNNTVHADSNNTTNCDDGAQSPPNENYTQQQNLPGYSSHSYENTLNNERRHSSFSTNGLYNGNVGGNMNHGHGNAQSVNHGNSFNANNQTDAVATLPNPIVQARVIPNRRCVPLWTPEDDKRLSTQQCWLRKQIETFPASAREVRVRGRNRLVDLGQIGIQCIHCKNLPHEGRGKGSSYFPSFVKSIYQSAQNMLTFHFKEDTCPLIPRRLLQQMRESGETSAICPRMAPKAGKSRVGGGKSLWEASAANVTGLIDTTVGIRYYSDIQSYRPLESIALGSTDGELDQDDVSESYLGGSALTRVEDKGKVTDFCLILMSQFGPYCSKATMPSSEVMEGDEWGSDIENEESLPSIGIVCNFCRGVSDNGKMSKGIFLSSKADTMMRNKNLARMYNHLLVCGPEDLKTKLMQAKNIHLPQSDKMKKGWKKQFFENFCNRLHASIDGGDEEGSSYDGEVVCGASGV